MATKPLKEDREPFFSYARVEQLVNDAVKEPISPENPEGVGQDDEGTIRWNEDRAEVKALVLDVRSGADGAVAADYREAADEILASVSVFDGAPGAQLTDEQLVQTPRDLAIAAVEAEKRHFSIDGDLVNITEIGAHLSKALEVILEPVSGEGPNV